MQSEGEREGSLRMSSEQKFYLVEYMENHLDFARGKFVGCEGRQTLMGMWEILTEQLNSMGPSKSSAKWKRAWSDLKIKTKKRASKFRQSSLQTGGGSPPPPLFDIDERIINIMGEESVYGIRQIKKGIILESEEPFPTEPMASTSRQPMASTSDSDSPQIFTEEQIQSPSSPCLMWSDSEDTFSIREVTLSDHDYCSTTYEITTPATTPTMSSGADTNLEDTPRSSRKTKKSAMMRSKETVEYFKKSEENFNKKIDEALDHLKKNNSLLEETNKLLKTLIEEIKKK